MKLVKKLIAGIPFTTYSKKVDYAVRNVIAVNKVKQIPIIVLFRKEVDTIIESRLKRMGLKIKYTLPFISGICGTIPVSKFGNLCGIIEVEKIFYDSRAHLMGSHHGLKTEEDIEQAVKTKFSYLNGKGITVAFIDSGVYPHTDLVKPRNRIVEFKDFVNDLNTPYDDNGHGTACIGAGFGASMDGKFRTAAYETNIICAKAFDKFGTGFYSDILAAMQWIVDLKEKFNIKITVLPFGTSNFSPDFDILSLASEKLWKSNLFVCTCTGNLGPYDSSITSPGVSAFSYTSAACSTIELPPRAAYFSGKGPVYNKCDKPDVIMPGVDIETLNSEVSYIPSKKGTAKGGKLSIQYTKYNGTSIAASFTAAAAALAYQKLGNLSPDDIKSILRACTVSINEIKSIQGAGIINIKKLEEI
ncbi:MAG TPA: S8 family serine peptidase [Patescibacteria group bacterium]|nr:S8 family serine peptidase [Patescibacteria group bacterium]